VCKTDEWFIRVVVEHQLVHRVVGADAHRGLLVGQLPLQQMYLMPPLRQGGSLGMQPPPGWQAKICQPTTLSPIHQIGYIPNTSSSLQSVTNLL
jgi:hypothetical protein